MPTILRAEKAAANHAPSESTDPQKARKFSRLFNESGYNKRIIGGAGKSAVAGRVMCRLAEDGWLVAAHRGRFDLAAVAVALTAALLHSDRELTRRRGELLRNAIYGAAWRPPGSAATGGCRARVKRTRANTAQWRWTTKPLKPRA
jgi:hypothetical protein